MRLIRCLSRRGMWAPRASPSAASPAASTLANPTNGCVPLNPFGLNVISPQAVNYVVDHNDYYFLNMEQDTARASMQGVLPWNLTGAGAPAMAFGVDYRKETMVSTADPYGAQGALGGGNFVPVRGEYNIMEGYGELDIPILKDSFVQSLDGNMAGRMTSYSTSGLVETWKLGLTSQVNDDIRLRATWSYDIRAPNLAELFNVIPASGGQVDYINGRTIAVALSDGCRQYGPAAGKGDYLFGWHRSDPALGTGSKHVVRLVFDQREGHRGCAQQHL